MVPSTTQSCTGTTVVLHRVLRAFPGRDLKTPRLWFTRIDGSSCRHVERLLQYCGISGSRHGIAGPGRQFDVYTARRWRQVWKPPCCRIPGLQLITWAIDKSPADCRRLPVKNCLRTDQRIPKAFTFHVVCPHRGPIGTTLPAERLQSKKH